MNNEHAESLVQREIDGINIRYGLLGHFAARKKLDRDYRLFWGRGKPGNRPGRELSWWRRETERLELITLLDLNPVQEARFERLLKNARKKENCYAAELQPSPVNTQKSVSPEKSQTLAPTNFGTMIFPACSRHSSITSYIKNCYPGAMLKKDFQESRDNYEITTTTANEIYMRFPQEIEEHCDQFTAQKLATAVASKEDADDVARLQINLAIGQIIEDLYAKYKRCIEKHPSKTINEALARAR